MPPAPSTPSPHQIVTTIIPAAAASTLVVAGIFFFFFQRCATARLRRRSKNDSSFRREKDVVVNEESKEIDGTIKGLTVEDEGLDVLYWRKLEAGQLRTGFPKVSTDPNGEEKRVDPTRDRPQKRVDSTGDRPQKRVDSAGERPKERVDPTENWPKNWKRVDPLGDRLQKRVDPGGDRPKEGVDATGNRPKKSKRVDPTGEKPQKRLDAARDRPKERVDPTGNRPKKSELIQEISLLHKHSNVSTTEKLAKPVSLFPTPPPLLPRRPQPQPPRPPPPPVIPVRQTPSPPPPPPPILAKKIPAPPPPPPIPEKKIPAPPPLPKRNPAPPPPPPKAGDLVSSLKPPPIPRRKPNSSSRIEDSTEEGLKETGVGQMKLKPLHWDKVIANADHSMIWDEINDGSFRFDDDLMETLFGYAATNPKSPEKNNFSSSSSSSNSVAPAQIFILEPRKSQNTAIVLRSLAISRKEILDALLDGQGLDADILEKLTKISPTQEEETQILQFNGNPTKLADAESFLYHILKAVPSAFTRFNAMLFRSNYDPEILHLKESLQTLELGCKELRTRGIFLKLLEAILKAGNRMNAGTARGNAQGFNLTALRKLSDVKSTDGKTTLLHFVVEQVVRSEGRRCVINRNYSLGRSNSQRSQKSDLNPESLTAQEERDKEYLMLGLPVLGGLSVEFSHVKKAATIDYDSFSNICSSLTARVAEIQQLVSGCGNGDRGGFVREMKGFLEECKEELKVVREEQTRVMELVKRTTEYYQAGASKDKGAHPLQLFAIVKDFLDMVDQVCLDITQKLQKKNITKSVGWSPPLSPSARIPVMFPNLLSHFMSDKSRMTPSSDSEDDF
ncbi:hypothetical protein L1049_028472 [Liquidambar formosana]|uniref:Formin-like protein n=1 Tax=Liquidambar formosana TaxID=63359 RepID=A0AAP0WWA1_LIQFO